MGTQKHYFIPVKNSESNPPKWLIVSSKKGIYSLGEWIVAQKMEGQITTENPFLGRFKNIFVITKIVLYDSSNVFLDFVLRAKHI